MLTIVGTGHVFRIAGTVRFIVRQTWPDAVLVELDEKRYRAMTQGAPAGEAAGDAETGGMYGSAARYQSGLADSYGATVGGEMLAAVEEGRLLGADVGFIDVDAAEAMDGLWEEMSLGERTRYRLSSFRDRLRGPRRAEKVAMEFSRNSGKMVEDLRRRYPTLVRRLLDDRDDHMASEIGKWMETHENVVAVVGDAHVDGILRRLGGVEAKEIRLADIMDPERMETIKSEMWGGGR